MARLQDIPTLAVALSDAMSATELKQLASLTGASLPTRKAELGQVIASYLAGDGLRRAWDKLDELQRAAVAEVVHAPFERFPTERFRAKYGSSANFGTMGSYVRDARPTHLRFFFYPLDGAGVAMPLDIKERLRPFVPEPVAAEVETFEQLPAPDDGSGGASLAVHTAESAAARELLSVLRLIDSGRVAVSERTRRPSAKTIAEVGEVLEGGDFYPYVPPSNPYQDENAGPIRAFAWPMIVQAGGLAQLAGSKLQLTKTGRKALGDPPIQTLVRLWRGWLGTKVLDELNRIECVKGQNAKGGRGLTSVTTRRRTIQDGLALCPVMRWIGVDELLRYLWATEHSFSVARNAWNLYLISQEYGSLGYDGTGLILEERYLWCLLFEYAATMGIVDVAFAPPAGARSDYQRLWGADDLEYFSRYDGLAFVRISPIGALALGIETEHRPAPTAAEPVLRVLANFEIVALGADLKRSDRMALDVFAVPASDYVWNLDGARLLAAINRGWSIEEVRRFLSTRSSHALPPTVVQLLDDAFTRSQRLKDRGLARLIECDDPALTALIANDRKTSRHCLAAGERHLVVPASSEAAFQRALRSMGYQLAPNDDKVTADTEH